MNRTDVIKRNYTKRGTVRFISEDFIEVYLTSINKRRWVKISAKIRDKVIKDLPTIKEENIKLGQGIYLLNFKEDNTKFYIGESNELKTRVGTHRLSEYKENNSQYIHNAIQKYGWNNTELRILEFFAPNTKTKFELLDLEEAYIFWLKTLVRDGGYNILSRGQDRTGYKWSQEQTDKIKIPVNQIDMKTGKLIKTWPSASDIERDLSISGSCIIRCCRGEARSAGNFYWKYSDSELENQYEEKRIKILDSPDMTGKNHKISVVQTDIKTNEAIKIWESITDAEKSLSKTSHHIASCCKGKRKSAYGYYWAYTDPKLANKYEEKRRHIILNSRPKNGYKLTARQIVEHAKIHKISVDQLNLKTGKLIRIWDSATDAGENLGIATGHICSCCRNKRKSAGGYSWSYTKIEAKTDC